MYVKEGKGKKEREKTTMGLENQKPTIVLIACQFIYSAVTLVLRGALLQGMSSKVFVVYRQGIAFLVIAPLAYYRRRETKCLEWKSFWLISLLAFVGVTMYQNMYFEGLFLASSSAASALTNMVPAVTFIIAYTIGLEKIKIPSTKSFAKIFGTIICIAGAVAVTLVKGPKLLNIEHMPRNSIFIKEGQGAWLLGCLLLFGSSCFWALWLILQVPASASYPDHLSLTAWMCLFATVQSAFVALALERDMNSWKLDSSLQIFACFFGGVGSAVTFFAQSWCISRKGPVFSAMFNPLIIVIVTISAYFFLHEELHAGSLVGALAVIVGLYLVLWGKANEKLEIKKENDQTVVVVVVDSKFSDNCTTDLEEPLLPEKSSNGESPA